MNLLADRKGKGSGRNYTITVQVADPFNNKAVGSAIVTVYARSVSSLNPLRYGRAHWILRPA